MMNSADVQSYQMFANYVPASLVELSTKVVGHGCFVGWKTPPYPFLNNIAVSVVK